MLLQMCFSLNMEYTMSQPLKRPLHNNLEKCPVVNCWNRPIQAGACTSSLRLPTSGLPGDRHSGKRRRREGHHGVTAAL